MSSRGTRRAPRRPFEPRRLTRDTPGREPSGAFHLATTRFPPPAPGPSGYTRSIRHERSLDEPLLGDLSGEEKDHDDDDDDDDDDGGMGSAGEGSHWLDRTPSGELGDPTTLRGDAARRVARRLTDARRVGSAGSEAETSAWFSRRSNPDGVDQTPAAARDPARSTPTPPLGQTPAPPPAFKPGPNAIVFTREQRGDPAAQPEKRYNVQRKWLVLDVDGESTFLEATKMEMQRELGVPFRDLMILDPALPTRYPSSVFIRPRALVINLEHIRAVVVSTRVVLMADRDDGGPDPHAKSFFQSLRKMLAKDPTPTPTPTDVVPETLPDDVLPDDVIPDDVIPDDVLPDDVLPNGGVSPEATAATTDILGLRQSPADLKVLALPFELRVVEAALFHVCARLLEETIELEDAAYPALDSLARHVTTKSLERVRRAKAAMNQLSRRVGAVREELSKLLADDGDMMAMCLTTREEKDRHVHDDGTHRNYRSGGEEESSHGAASNHGSRRKSRHRRGDRRPPATGPRVRRRSSSSSGVDDSCEKEPPPPPAPRPFPVEEDAVRVEPHPPPVSFPDLSMSPIKLEPRRSLSEGSSSDGVPFDDLSSSEVEDSDVGEELEGVEEHEGVEALLEAYYMHVDFSFARLAELRDATEDTEDLAEISLDSQRNRLIKIDLVISNATLAVGVFGVVAGAFGMNLPVPLRSNQGAFEEVLIATGAACVALFTGVLLYLRSQRLLQT